MLDARCKDAGVNRIVKTTNHIDVNTVMRTFTSAIDDMKRDNANEKLRNRN